jgi:5-methylcytosine-specific restriction endonuclease McrA
VRHRIIVAEPHPHSMAAAVLLNRKLKTHELSTWLRLRDDFLARRKAIDGTLKCHYCGKSNLNPDVPPDAPRHKLGRLATIDHVRPRCKGGSDEESNLVVACFKCNQKKADKILGS